MANLMKRIDITSADTKQIGFEYQYLYFILRLLQLSLGEEVGYEALDDVHVINASNKETLYIQVKHTIGTAASGSQANLTKLSGDLWKTLSNWSRLISDPIENRSKAENQIAFINVSRFILVVNRKVDNNEVITEIQKLRQGLTTGSKLRAYMNKLQAETKDEQKKEYIGNVIALSPRVFTAFLKNTVFESFSNNLFEQIREEIRKKMTDDAYIDDVLGSLYLQLKEDFFDKAQGGKHQIITYSEWMEKYRGVFNRFRTTLLPFREYNPLLPEHLEQQVFVKELIEIGAVDIQNDGLSEIAELTEFYLKIELQLNDWCNEGRITIFERDKFHKNAALIWKRIHQSCHQTTRKDVSQDNDNALNCFYDVMKEKLTLLSTELGVELSNGEFIKLANEERIGWKYKWLIRGTQHGN
ncbi:dsDNA nuclease domain-containing protein [Intestinimonas butyriciproducens]|uniref:dsDNA nuclease domain-containing protein n=1 Tax=Intestinimonas butyriciproducens TaxID=1297617 RepID=UPI002432C904|nr:dsDNA nuclease domain-containing protein [Intestinimonas butyriciproducens]